MKKKLNLLLIYEIINNAVFSAAAIFLVRDLIQWDVKDAFFLFLILLASVTVSLVWNYRKNKYLYLGFGVILILAVVICVIVKPNFLAIVQSTFFRMELIAILASVVSFILFQYSKIRNILISMEFLLMIFLPFISKDLSACTVGCILFLFINLCVSICNHFYMKSAKEGEEKKVTSSLLPFYLVPIIILLIIPKSENPINWQFVVDFYHKTVEVCENVKEFGEDTIMELQFTLGLYPEEYRMSFTGYSGEGRLGGGIADNEAEMIMLGGKRPRGNVYLIGAISDTYTGSSWEKEVVWPEDQRDYYLDYAEMLRAMYLSDSDSETVKENIAVVTLSVQHLRIHTKTLFYPIKPTSVTSLAGKPYLEDGPNLMYERAVRSDRSAYEVTYLDIDYQGEWMQNILQNPKQYQYESNEPVTAQNLNDIQKEMLNSYPNASICTEAEEKLEARAEFIEDNFLQLPDALPQRVYDLADEITEGCTTDTEKMEKIKEYLADYTYTKSPIEITEGDFVDQFLFETKEGYCTYFSSVMAVLGRCSGVPTRYVEGFFCDFTSKTGPREYTIYGNGGHAWCEYYVEGVGWIPVEATTGCGFSRTYLHNSGESVIQETQIIDWEVPEEEERTVLQNVGLFLQSNPLDSEAFTYIWKTMVGLCIMFGIGFIGYLIGKKIYKRKKYQNADGREKIRIKASKLFLFLDILAKKRKDEYMKDTVKEYMEQARTYLGEDASLLEEIYLKARYSKREINRDMVVAFEDAEVRLKEKVIENAKKSKKVQYRLFGI